MEPKPVAINIADLQKPEQLLDLIQNENIRDLVSGILMAHGIIAADDRPLWAIRCLAEFWRCCLDMPKSRRAKSECYQFGHLCGFISRVSPQEMENEHGMRALVASGELIPLIHTLAASLPASEAFEFYTGFANGIKRGESVSPANPFLVYLLLAVKWREVATFRNTTQIQAWLESLIGPNLAGQRDRIAKICQKVRLPLTDKGGRPPGKPRKLSPI